MPLRPPCGVGQVALVAAADLQPLGALARKPHVDAVVDFEIVGQHQRAGAVDDVGEADGVAEHLLRRALEPEIVGVHHGAVDRDRMHHAKLLELAHQRHVRIDVGIPAPHLEDALGLLLALLLLQRVEVVAEHRVLQRGDELGIVVVVAEIAVAVRIGPDADLRFPEAVGRAVLAHLADRDLARAVGMHVVGLRLRRLDRGAVREQRMRGVAQVLEIDLPVAVVGVLEHAAGRLDLAVRRAVDHVVERRGHVAERFFQVRPVGRFAREDEAAIALHPRHRLHRHLRIADLEVARIAVVERHGLEPAVEMIGPAVIAAGEFVGVALLGRHHHRAAVGALVADHAQARRSASRVITTGWRPICVAK